VLRDRAGSFAASDIRHLVIKTGDNPEDHRIVLTADTAELQRFVIRHLKTEGAWNEGLELQPAE
jgi:hypothetical protein